MKKTRFISFYSYKGGVGRSLALANIAYILAERGNRVLIMDLDLEAPGQHRTDLFNDVPPSLGVLDLLSEYLEYHESLSKNPAPPFDWVLENYCYPSSALQKLLEIRKIKTKGSLRLMPAGTGLSKKGYLERLQNFHWQKFYKHYGSQFFYEMRFRLIDEGLDYVLIDSRTGLSEALYLSTFILADTVVCISGFNRQSIEGLGRVLNLFRLPDNEKKFGQKCIHLVGSPFPQMSKAEIERRMSTIRSTELPNFRDWDFLLPYFAPLALQEDILAMAYARNENLYVFEIYRLLDALADIVLPTEAEEPKDEPSNPILEIRAEYTKPEVLQQYFVSPGKNILKSLTGFMPHLVFGGRGSGKTTLARSLSFEVQYLMARGENKSDHPNYLGLWLKLDIDVLRSFHFEEKSPTERSRLKRLFDQFLDIVLLRKALQALDTFGGIESWVPDQEKLYQVLGREFGSSQEKIFFLPDFISFLEEKLSEIRRYINNPDKVEIPFLVQVNIFLKTLVEEPRKQKYFKEHLFIVYLDEYENFSEYQQQIINTRVKQVKETDAWTYHLLMRNSGLRTSATFAEGQPLQRGHDYRDKNLEEDYDYSIFKDHLQKVLIRFLENAPYFKSRGWTDPNDLFASLDANEEAESICGRRGNKQLLEHLKDHNPDSLEIMSRWFGREKRLLKQTVGVLLLNQGKDPKDLIAEFERDTAKARDWYHNYHRGALFWLASLYKNKVSYAGFSNIVGLAGGNIRYGLDICHEIFNHWLSSDPKFPILPEIQDYAIQKLAEKYFRDLSYRDSPNLKELKQFTERLGRLFEIIHKSPRQSEPEINHFQIKEGGEDRNLDGFLKELHREGILRFLPGNKQKSLADAHRDAWQLHPRFAPFFNLSWRRKKMLTLQSSEVKLLKEAERETWTKFVNSFTRRFFSEEQSQEVQRKINF